MALVWLPGQSTSVRDHVSWCVVGIPQGEEREVSYEVVGEAGDRCLLPIGESVHRVGSVSVLQPPGDIHTVYNPGPDLAVSIHIYGADVRQVGTSIRHRYDLPVVEAVPRTIRRVAAGGRKAKALPPVSGEEGLTRQVSTTEILRNLYCGAILGPVI